MTAYYNEWEPYAADWLENLIMAGHVAPGHVDRRSIVDVRAPDLHGYTQCHFFAGIGGWSLALRLAGWDDTRPVWTGSCPCQPFSSAGQGKGQTDERHLWPEWNRLISECKPTEIFGEQVSKAIAHGWLDEVKHDLESSDYAFAAAILPACAVQAPHERERIFFVAHSALGDDRRNAGELRKAHGGQEWNLLPESGGTGFISNPSRQGLSIEHESGNSETPATGIITGGKFIGICAKAGAEQWQVEPAVGRVANGIPARMGAIKAYGNAIVPQIAAKFIEATM
jgi:DNA (cytosine-5)-methyltransferase 1